MTQIRFGTDGWRAIVGKDFIPENIAKVAQAFADLYPHMPEKGRPVVIGYDRRNQSPEAARLIAEVLVGNDIPVVISEDFCPTPTVAWYAKTKNCAAGIMVTASHNPPEWNGIKFKESYGGAASAEYCRPIEERIEANDAEGRAPKRASLDGNRLVARFDPHGEYLQSVAKFFDLDRITAAGVRALLDPLYGAGVGFFTPLLPHNVDSIHTKHDILFGGLHPEPIRPYVDELMETLKKSDGAYWTGLVTDGDADRLGAVDENGDYVTTHEVFSLIILHAVRHKKWSGTIIKSISTTQMIDRIGRKEGMPVETTPVGFKYISPAMKKPGVMVGGEESGGYGFPRHVPERDGVFSGLMLMELMATTGKKLSELVSDLQREFGPTKYRRIDFHLSAQEIERARAAMKMLDIREIGARKVVRHETMDGHHFLFDDDSWLLFRASGTEPLIRIYAEAPTADEVERYLAVGKQAVGLA